MINLGTSKLSIIIPCYNEINTIDKIIQKIKNSLSNYNYPNYEIIIVDDNSNDGTMEKLRKYDLDDKRYYQRHSFFFYW